MSFTLAESLGRRGLSGFSWLCLAALLVVLPQGWVSAWAWERDLRWFYLFLIAFFVSTLLVPYAIHLSVRYGVMDLPDSRKMHRAATPRLGGLAVYGAFAFTLLRNFQWGGQTAGLLAGGTLIYLMGVAEDAKGLSAAVRLAGQLAAAALVIAGGVCVSFIPRVPGERLLEVLFTAVWLVGITNAINFLDGIDGLAAGMGTICSLLFVSVAWPERQGPVAFASASLAGACLGFLPYNWHRAKVFLGDAGATFIGFTLAGLAVMGSWGPSDNPFAALATPVLILGIPIFDMTYTTVARIRRGAVRTFRQWLEYTGKDHFHHRLMRLGMDAPEAVGFILMVNLALGLNALVAHFSVRRMVAMLLLSQSFILFMVIVVLMLLGREVGLPND